MQFLISENRFLCSVFTYPLIFIESLLFIYFIKVLFNSKSINITFLKTFCLSIICATIKVFLPLPFNLIPTAFVLTCFLIVFYNLSFIKSFFGVIIFTLVSALLEYIINLAVSRFFTYNLVNAPFIPLYKIAFSLILYFSVFFIIRIFKRFNSNLNLFSNDNNKENFKLILIIFLICLIILPNYFFLTLLNMNLPTSYVLYNILSGIIFFLVGIYSTKKINKLQITTRELETANLYNNTLSKLVDSNRGFRHDINNIINAIGGYIELNDLNGLKNYYNTGLLPEIKKSNNLSLLNPDVINSPPIFGLFLAKYNYADTLGVKIELNSFFDYSSINMNIFDFVKIFGILFDNAIEAASFCDNKLVSIHVTIDFYNRKQVFKISNTFSNKDIDIDLIFQKDFSTKEVKSGFGLWEVNQLLKKYSNVKLITSKDDSFFTQKLELYF